MNGHVFVSHGSDDRVQANELAAFIEAKGAKAWIAPRNVRPGQDYSEQLQEAIETCSAFIVLVTDKANRSPYVRAEVEMAFSEFKPIFPVRLSDIKPAAGLALFLKIRHWTDAFGPDREANLARLAREVQTAAGVEVDPTQVVREAEARAAAANPVEAVFTSPPAPPPPPPPPPPPVATAPIAAPPAAPAYVAPAQGAPAYPAATQPTQPTPGYGPAYPHYQPPVAPMPPSGTAPTVGLQQISLPIDPGLLQAAIGPNAPFYLERWAAMDAKGTATSWNWPAALAGFFWFAYRKMWLAMAGVFVAVFALLMITGTNPRFASLFWLFNAGIGFASGLFANYLYRQQIEKLVEETVPLGRAAQLEALAVRGGVSWLALALTLGTIGGAIALSVIATTGQNELNSQKERSQDNRTAPAPANFAAPATPPVAPQNPPQNPARVPPGQEGFPPQELPQDQGTGENGDEDRSFGEDEARQDEIRRPEE